MLKTTLQTEVKDAKLHLTMLLSKAVIIGRKPTGVCIDLVVVIRPQAYAQMLRPPCLKENTL